MQKLTQTRQKIVFAIEDVVKDVSLSQSGCEVNEDGLVMIDSGASVNVCPKWFGNWTLQKSDGSVLLRGANGRRLEDYGNLQIWLKIGINLERYDFHVVEVTKPILSVCYLCEHGIETHLAREPFLKCGDRREPLIKRNGVYFVMRTSRRLQNHAYEQEAHKSHAYELKIHNRCKSNAYEQEIHKSHGTELKILKSAYELKACKTRSRVVHPNVLLRIQLTLTEFLLRQERSQSPYHVSFPSLRKRNTSWHTSHSNHGAHFASKAKHNLNTTNVSSAPLKTANFQLFSVTTLF